MNIDTIYEKIVNCPLEVTDTELQFLVVNDPDVFDKLRKITLRVFDMNERSLRESSDATKGFMGMANLVSKNIRILQYNQKIKSSKSVPGKERILIVAEGDSWFQFPIFIKDVLDWLKDLNPHYFIYSIAYAGDWMTNMIYDGKYIEELSVHRPDVFLLSGGGNDLVGSNRLALMVHNHRPDRVYRKYADEREIRDFKNEDAKLENDDRKEIFEIQNYITLEFYSFILILKLQYMKIINSINRKYPDMIIVSNGYDFAIPSYSKVFDIQYPLKSFVNWLVGTGKWLVRPMRIKGITEPELQRKIVKAFIYELNIMLDDIANNPNYYNFFRAHTLGLFRHHKDWFDELHLKSHNFRKVASIYNKLIDDQIIRKRQAPLVMQVGKMVKESEGGEDANLILEKKAADLILEVKSPAQKVYTIEDVKGK